MKIEVHFYDKLQVAVTISTEKIFGDHDHELLMYAWFTLRQLHNQGHHLAADAAAGLIANERWNIIQESLQNNPKIPDALGLLMEAEDAKFPIGDTSVFKSMAGSQILARYAAQSSPAHIYTELFNEQILSKIPELIEYPRKPGNKLFIGTAECVNRFETTFSGI